MDPKKILKGKRVLIVDDEEDMLQLLKKQKSSLRPIFTISLFWISWGSGDMTSWKLRTKKIFQP